MGILGTGAVALGALGIDKLTKGALSSWGREALSALKTSPEIQKAQDV